MPCLIGLVASLFANYLRHRAGKSTICSTCRKRIGPRMFLAGWAALTAWFLPHYMNPAKFNRP